MGAVNLWRYAGLASECACEGGGIGVSQGRFDLRYRLSRVGQPLGSETRAGLVHHLRVDDIQTFFGTSENAVKSQIWVTISVYVLVASIKKRLAIEADLYTILQILSLTLFEETFLFQLVTGAESMNGGPDLGKIVRQGF